MHGPAAVLADKSQSCWTSRERELVDEEGGGGDDLAVLRLPTCTVTFTV